MLEGIAGGIISFLANVLYIDLRRKGRRGWSRIILFWMGTPLTWLWLFLVREGSAPELVEPPDDADAILAEIRRDRSLKAGSPEERRKEEDPLLDKGGSSFNQTPGESPSA